MYGNIFYDKRRSMIHWCEYDDEHNRTEYKEKWVPDYFVETLKESEYKSQCGINLKKVKAKTFGQREKQIKELKDCGKQIYGSDLSVESKFILERWPDDITKEVNIRFMFLDIETECENGFPEAEKAEERINLITVWSSVTKKFVTFGLEHGFKNPTEHDVEYRQSTTEHEMLMDFIQYVEKHRYDIWSGWNSSGFDVPYIFNRILRVLDGIDVNKHCELLHEAKNFNSSNREQVLDDLAEINKKYNHIKRLSPFNVVTKQVKMVKDTFTKEMKPQMGYVIEGVTDYDYLKLDQQFRLGKRDSYKLDSVAKDELGETKLEYEGSMKNFYKNDWNRFVEYNIQDVNLLVRLNENLNYIPQAIALSYRCHCQFKDNFGTVQKAETAIYNFLMKDGMVMIDRKERENSFGKIPGAYVTPKDKLRRGFHKWIIDLDIASLYPSLMRGINISYDTKKGKVLSDTHIFDIDENEQVTLLVGDEEKTMKAGSLVKFIKKKGYAVASNNVLFENVNTKKGVLVKMLDMWYAQRKQYKKAEASYRQAALDAYDNAEEVSGGKEITEKGSTKHVSDEDYNSYHENMRLSGVNFNLQWSCKILLNSIYGCLASSFFRFYDPDLGTAVTTSGRTVITNSSDRLNDFFNVDIYKSKVIKRNFEVKDETIEANAALYTDTDSIYLTFDALMNKLGIDNDDKSRLKMTKFFAKMAMNELEKYSEKFFPSKFNAKNSIFWDQELIARKGIWCQPKKYVCNILEENGKPPKDDMLKKGLDIVRSSIPRRFKVYITEAVDMILKDHTEEELKKFIRDVYSDFKKWPFQDIAIPSSCNNLVKWGKCESLKFLPGTPQHMKAAISFNYYLDKFKLKEYEHIKERDKFSMLFLGKNTNYSIESIGYKDKLPKELDIDSLIDRDRHFERGIIMPLTQIFDAIKWAFPETKNVAMDVEDLFE